MSNDKIKGEVKDLKGKAKEAIGDATDDTSMKVKGKADQAEGKAQKAYGDAKEKLSGDD